MEYKAEMDEAVRRKWTYEDHTYKLYALLWEKHAKAMQNNIASISDYDSSVYNNTIVLLQAIKEHFLNYQETSYEMHIISDAFRSTFTSRQNDGKSIQDYTRRFKSSTEILEYHLRGPLNLENVLKTMEVCDETNAKKTNTMSKQASEIIFTSLYLEKSDHDKYGFII